MNTSIVSAIVCIIFFIVKMMIQYGQLEIRSMVRDTVVVYLSSLAGMIVYNQLNLEKGSIQQAQVFTEKPNF